MSTDSSDFFRTQVWYPVLATHTFLSSFIPLRPEAVRALKEGKENPEDDDAVREAILEMGPVMAGIPGHCFVSVDCCAPTDTERYELKNGAVYSPESAWRYLARSEKVRKAAGEGKVSTICLRPYRHMTKPREFRLFIDGGRLVAMSQYHLVRHFRRLEGIRERFWQEASDFVGKIAWLLPVDRLVMDVYFTAAHRILIVDLNPWGEPTDPLLLRSWDRDWSQVAGIVLMPPPMKVTGEVNVTF